VNKKFYYIDLFAGMGGFRLALDAAGGECVYSSEIDPTCRKFYKLNFGDDPDGDITKVDENSIPDHQLLVGGFPCQSFSIAGKKMGFADPRGTLFFDILRIAKAKRPAALLLENVKHLSKHDGGRTLGTIKESLEAIGYHFSWKVLNSARFGVPQNRERTIMVASTKKNFDFAPLERRMKEPQNMREVLETEPKETLSPSEYTLLPQKKWKRQMSGLIFVGYRNKPGRKVGIREGTEHLSRCHKQPNRIYHADGTHPTLPSQESAGRFWVYDGERVRRLSVSECLMMQGFPRSHTLPDNKSAAYRQIGNSVPPPMIKPVADEMLRQGLIIGHAYFS
jgi:DNA (cytosine-5)-methyltransferase 1